MRGWYFHSRSDLSDPWHDVTECKPMYGLQFRLFFMQISRSPSHCEHAGRGYPFPEDFPRSKPPVDFR